MEYRVLGLESNQLACIHQGYIAIRLEVITEGYQKGFYSRWESNFHNVYEKWINNYSDEESATIELKLGEPFGNDFRCIRIPMIGENVRDNIHRVEYYIDSIKELVSLVNDKTASDIKEHQQRGNDVSSLFNDFNSKHFPKPEEGKKDEGNWLFGCALPIIVLSMVITLVCVANGC